MKNIKVKTICICCCLIVLLSACTHEVDYGTFVTISKGKDPVLGYSKDSGVSILKENGSYFKDLNKNGKIDPYEDWRLSAKQRAENLVTMLSSGTIAGLMLYGDHQNLESDTITEFQRKMIVDNYVRHILIDHVENTETAVQWSNHVQALAESMEWGIPLNNSSDPRHTKSGIIGISGGAGGEISKWPENLGLAATFDPELVRHFGEIGSREYRALGITTALSPQVDLGTEPRWARMSGTFGESPELVTAMGEAYIDGFQSSRGNDEIHDGWGYSSVNCMAKHWPGGGTVESGRDAHYSFGKFGVYPGNNFAMQLKPFINGAFNLKGSTREVAAVMPYYTISYNQDTIYGENVGNGFSKYIVTDLLRERYSYERVVCTDWHITGGRKWGVEKLRTTERFYKILKAGVDQFGAVNSTDQILKAFELGVQEYGEVAWRKRMEDSAVRILINMFRIGLFENPYLDIEESTAIVGKQEYVKAGYGAQLKSVVLLKNKNAVMPVSSKKTVYIPKVDVSKVSKFHIPEAGEKESERSGIYEYPVDVELVKQYFDITENPNNADVALVFVEGPLGNVGYDRSVGYMPISLQYEPYTATNSREISLAPETMNDPKNENRSYLGKSATVSNSSDLQTILDTKKQMGERPVIVCMNLAGPVIVSEFEHEIDGLLVSFSVQDGVLLDIVSGKTEPSGLLPVQMPANMKTVETQLEDVPFDMDCHRDSEGHLYDFAFGLNWSGVISDSRTTKYKSGVDAQFSTK